MMQTPMLTLLSHIKQMQQLNPASADQLLEIIQLIETQYVSLEKQSIMHAWLSGFEELRPYVDHSEDYYDETYFQHADSNGISRFEVIDHTHEKLGRCYVKRDIQVELSYQDGGKTLKAFITDKV